jgi:hypothetical protein
LVCSLSTFQPFRRSAIPSFRHPPFRHSVILPLRHSAIPPFRHSAIPPFHGGATKKAAAARRGRQRLLDNEGSSGATTNAEPGAVRQRMQNWRRRDDKGSDS